jgi:hypothetical protein
VEQVARVVAALDRHQPLVVVAVVGTDAVLVVASGATRWTAPLIG